MLRARLGDFDTCIYERHDLVRYAMHLIAKYQGIFSAIHRNEFLKRDAALGLLHGDDAVSGVPKLPDGPGRGSRMVPRHGLSGTKGGFFDFPMGWGAGNAA